MSSTDMSMSSEEDKETTSSRDTASSMTPTPIPSTEASPSALATPVPTMRGNKVMTNTTQSSRSPMPIDNRQQPTKEGVIKPDSSNDAPPSGEYGVVGTTTLNDGDMNQQQPLDAVSPPASRAVQATFATEEDTNDSNGSKTALAVVGAIAGVVCIAAFAAHRYHRNAMNGHSSSNNYYSQREVM
ncbi:hypothetical protein CCR75_001619 [Bremia lactucae]|uniref:Uncharacterized protein n=1 Tax=Bremia lactucae TaxID=4779 RepID=A0A976FPD4_BRELC|nr:hypothetical protein CCR75_001619 [Bremia lactucae]